MSRLEARQIAIGIALETAFWLLIAAVFLGVYVIHFAAQPQAIVPHLSLLATLVFALWCARFALWRMAAFGKVARLVNALITAAFLLLLTVYYAVVLVGLQSWGRVVTWPLMRTYALQLGDLLRSLSISPTLVACITALLFAGLTGAVALLPAQRQWTRQIASLLSPRASLLVLGFGAGIGAVQLFQFVAVTPAHSGEPFSLTVFPEQAVHKMQNNALEGTSALNLAEAAERAAYQPTPQAQKRNVILIVSDALRADHMSVYGYTRDTTPFLSEQMRAGHVSKVDQMIAACSESSCGLLAIARSKYVHQLSSNAFTLQQVLRRYGYRIHLILSGDHTNFYGLRNAYGQVDSYVDGSMVHGRYMNDDRLVLDQLAQFGDWDGQPTLLQFHLMSTHALGTRHPESMRFLPVANYSVWAALKTARLSELDVARSVNYYDNGVLQADAMVKSILAQLQQKGYLRDALVVVTADHGESLGEHDVYGHTKTLYQSEVHVPFLLLRYGYAARAPLATGRIASQVDIAPTILAEMDMKPPSTWAGKALQQPSEREFIFMQQSDQVGVVDLRQTNRPVKYWKDVRSGEEFLFDLSQDIAETSNLLASAPPAQISQWRLAIVPAAAAVIP